MTIRFVARALGLSAILFAATSARADIITDGGFEMPSVTATQSQYITFSAGQTFGGWTVNSGSVDVVGEGNPFIKGAAYEGTQYLDLDGSAAGKLSQVFTTTVGGTYTLSFAYSNNYAGTTKTDMAAVAVDVSGGTPTVITHSGTSAGNLNWQVETITFTASSTSTTLSFTSLDPTKSTNGILLDAISVTAATAVPEPSSLALSGVAGLFGLALAYRRRNRSNA